MLEEHYTKKNSIVNKNKLIYIPLLIGVVAILTVSVSSYLISRHLLMNQMEQYGINMAEITTKKIQNGIHAVDIIDNLIEDKIRLAGKSVIDNSDVVNNELLRKIANDFNIDELNYYNADGEVMYTNTDILLGWSPPEGEYPIRKLTRGNGRELIEEIRKCLVTHEYFKYGYFVNDDGGIIQVGIKANKINDLTKSFNYQEIVESLVQEDTILYARILNTDLVAIADSDVQDIGIDYAGDEDYMKAINGDITTCLWYYNYIEKNALEVAAPIVIDEKVVGILGIGLSMDYVHSSIFFIMLCSIIITGFMVLFFLWVQNRNVVKPITQLDRSIRKINVEDVLASTLPLPERDTFNGLFTTFNDLIEKVNKYFYQLRETEEYIGHIAYHDNLTNLPNRSSFRNKLRNELNNCNSGAVMLLDIDNFKSINDTLGHVYGDKVLKKFAESLESIKEDNIYLSKFGGDEFLILLTDEEDITSIENYAKKIIGLFKNKLVIDEDEVYVSCSIGITMYPLNSNNVDQLIMNADMALYSVKSSGKNNYMFFNDEMLEKVNGKIEIENIVREALETKGFKLLYQPQICTFTGKIVGFEALLRIKDKNISPAQFIPAAEETGMIIDIGRWITQEVINQIANWRDKGLDIKPIAINFSAKQLNDEGYVRFLETKLKENCIDARYIEIEITESLFMETKDKTTQFLQQLKTLGVKIALDDFGTGYSSLSYLTFLPVDKLKLDKSLSDRYLETRNVKVVEGVISLAHSLNLEVVAEGIEDVEQYNQLSLCGCNFIQGYLFSRPLEAEALENIYYNNFIEDISSKETSE